MFEKPRKERAVLIGGTVIAAISGLPGLSLLNCCCCAGIIIGGVVAAMTYQKEFTPEHAPLETSDVLIVGLLAGLVGAAGATLLSAIIMLSIGPLEAKMMADVWEKVLDRLVANRAIPESAAETMREQFEHAIDQGLTFGSLMAGFFVNIIVYPLFGMLGGLIGHGLFRPKTPPTSAQ